MSDRNGTKAGFLAVLLAICVALSSWALLTTVSHGERITKAETRLDGVKESLDGIRGWLKSMDEKLDEIRRR